MYIYMKRCTHFHIRIYKHIFMCICVRVCMCVRGTHRFIRILQDPLCFTCRDLRKYTSCYGKAVFLLLLSHSFIFSTQSWRVRLPLATILPAARSKYCSRQGLEILLFSRATRLDLGPWLPWLFLRS
jgi:hypothetical protein